MKKINLSKKIAPPIATYFLKKKKLKKLKQFQLSLNGKVTYNKLLLKL